MDGLGMIQDYNDWRCRSIVGRALYWMGDTESAMRVLSTVVNVEPNMDDDPEYGLSEAEHKVLCLRDIAEIVWKLAKSEEAALTYLKEAYDLSLRPRRYVLPQADGAERSRQKAAGC